MENKENEDVKDVETKYIEPTKDDEIVQENENDTQPLSSDGENEEENEEEETSEEEVESEPKPIVEESKPVEGESLREYALRKELENIRKQLRKEKQEELFQKVDSKTDDDLLSEYDPDEVKKLEKIITKLGYAKKQEIQSQTYEEKANDQLSDFLDKHPEYLPENDKDGILWNQFRSEFSMYKQPENPKEYKKIFERIHTGLKGFSSIDIKKINASKEKLKVASHTGATMQGKSVQKQQIPTGLRTDMLKGFDEEEVNDLLS